VTTDPGPLEVLDEAECLRLLTATRLGRVGIAVDGVPAVFPVHYRLSGRDPVFLTSATSRLARDGDGQPACLEIDDADPENHTGWSVLVTGEAAVVTDTGELSEVRALPLRPWVGEGDVFVRLRTLAVTGRRVAPHRAGPAGRSR
jgi:uncharacterized protein